MNLIHELVRHARVSTFFNIPPYQRVFSLSIQTKHDDL